MDHNRESYCHYKAAINHAAKMPVSEAIDRLQEISDAAIAAHSRLMESVSDSYNFKQETSNQQQVSSNQQPSMKKRLIIEFEEFKGEYKGPAWADECFPEEGFYLIKNHHGATVLVFQPKVEGIFPEGFVFSSKAMKHVAIE